MTYELFGRKVESYLFEEMRVVANIDVMQNEADCPLNVPMTQRRMCQMDCGGTFISAMYHIATKQFIKFAGRVVDGIVFDEAFAAETGMDVPQLLSLIESGQDIQHVPQPPSELVLYKGRQIGRIQKCQYAVLQPGTLTGDQEIDQYIQYLSTHPEEVLAECGITIDRKRKRVKTAKPKNIRSGLNELRALRFGSKSN